MVKQKNVKRKKKSSNKNTNKKETKKKINDSADNQLEIKKNGGPYSKMDRERRREEVWDFHHNRYKDTEIADILHVSRHTVRKDLEFLYKKAGEEIKNPLKFLVKPIHELGDQRARLEDLIKIVSFKGRLSLEKLLLDNLSKACQVSINLDRVRSSEANAGC